MPSAASVLVALCVGLAAVAFYIVREKRKPLAAARTSADATPAKISDEEHARRRLARLAVLEEQGKRAAEEARAKAEAAAARAAEERLAREAQKRQQPSPAPVAVPARPPAAPRAVLEPPNAKLQALGGPATAPAPQPQPEGGAVSVRVQFVHSRAPVQLKLPVPLPTVGELKRRVHETYADIPPERQRLVFAGQILAPEEKELALVKNFGDGACVICQELAAPSTPSSVE